MKKNRKEIIEFINSLKGYEGYVQFSNRPIEDVWQMPSDIFVEEREGFVYEAHFCNTQESLSIKQINNAWFVSKTALENISPKDINTYKSKFGAIDMAQIWEDEADEYCEDMHVKKLKKVVFAGFKKKKTQKQEKLLRSQKFTQEEQRLLLEHFLEIFTPEYIDSILKPKE